MCSICYYAPPLAIESRLPARHAQADDGSTNATSMLDPILFEAVLQAIGDLAYIGGDAVPGFDDPPQETIDGPDAL